MLKLVIAWFLLDVVLLGLWALMMDHRRTESRRLRARIRSLRLNALAGNDETAYVEEPPSLLPSLAPGHGGQPDRAVAWRVSLNGSDADRI